MNKSAVYGCLLAVLLLSNSAMAEKANLEKMKDSVVRVVCSIKYKGEGGPASTGTGFIVGNGDSVITNSHVVDQCHPAHKRKTVTTLISDLYLEPIKKANFNDPADMLKRLPPDLQRAILAHLNQDRDALNHFVNDKAWRIKFLDAVLTKYINDRVDSEYANLETKLSVVHVGKAGGDPVWTDVTSVLWDAWTDHKYKNGKENDVGFDMAVLRLVRPLGEKSPVRGFATGDAVSVGDDVWTIGFPGGSDVMGKGLSFEFTVKKGIVSKFDHFGIEKKELVAQGVKGVPIIETDAAINSGNSGGPMFNERGEVVGINTWGIGGGAQGIFYTQNISVAVPILKDLGIPVPPLRDSRNSSGGALMWGALGLLLMAGAGGAGYFYLRRKKAGGVPKPVPGKGALPAEKARDSAARTLKGLAGEYVGAEIPLDGGATILGRDPNAAGIVFAKTPDISGKHCSIRFDAGLSTYEVTNLGSSNGTFSLPDGTRLPANTPTRLRPGKKIRLGATTEFELL